MIIILVMVLIVSALYSYFYSTKEHETCGFMFGVMVIIAVTAVYHDRDVSALEETIIDMQKECK